MSATEKTDSKTRPAPSAGSTPGNPPVPGEKEKKIAPELPPAYKGVLKYSFWDETLKILGNPFVLLGGLLASVFFLTKGKLGILDGHSEKDELIRKLRKKNKKLKAEIKALTARSDNETIQLPDSKIPLRLPSPERKPHTFYLD